MDYSYQLYSARNEKSLDETLKTLKSLGYAQVEGWGGQFADPAALAASVKNAGLLMPTAHIGSQQLEDTAAALKIADIVDIKTIYCPAPPAEVRTTDSSTWRRFAELLAKVAADFKKAGKGFGYHNHNWEFAKNADGSVPMDILLEVPGLEWEFDLAWAVKGNQDPIAWMKKHGDRITAIHVKDIAPAGEALDEDGWADVGQGTLNWKQLIADAKANTKATYFVMEHDKPSDALRFARRSIEAVKQWS